MASRTQLTADLIFQFEQDIKNESETFRTIRKNMDNALNGFLWEDPVAQRFKEAYSEGLEPLNSKLLPAMENYQRYLNILGEKTREWTQD